MATKLETITLAQVDGRPARTVEAHVIGALAIFQDGKLWNITHVNTGLLLFMCPSRAKAVKAANELQRDLDWN